MERKRVGKSPRALIGTLGGGEKPKIAMLKCFQ